MRYSYKEVKSLIEFIKGTIDLVTPEYVVIDRGALAIRFTLLTHSATSAAVPRK